MNRNEIDTNHSRAIRFANKGRIKDAFTLTGRLINETDKQLLLSEHQQLEENYKRIAEFTYKGVADPERQNVLNSVIKSLIDLADLSRHQLMKPYLEKKIFNREEYKPLSISSNEVADSMIEEISFSKEVSNVLQGAGNNQDAVSAEQLFYHFLLSSKLTDPEVYFVEKLFSGDSFEWHEKSLLVSAMTLSLIQCFDEQKIDAMFKAYTHGDDKVWQRALVGLVLAFYLYDERLEYYNKAKGIRFQLGENDQNDKDIESIIIQLIRSKDTEQVTKKMQEEIIPEMIKLKPKIEDKLSLEELLSEETDEDKNPKWETFFKDTPGLADKMEEFTKMQMEGADVFMSAFSMLKQFSFFDRPVNWFRPFHADEPSVREVIENEEISLDKDKLLQGIEKSAFLCNSDKYSFLFNVRQMPAAQKQMMFQMLQQELDQMNELASQEDMIDDTSRNKTVYVRYIQDLYRFFKLSNLKDDFGDIFSLKLDVHHTESFGQMVNDKLVVRNIAEFYFESEHFEDAVSIYSRLVDQGVNEPEVYEKLGYAYRRMEMYEEALNNHQKAELFDSNRVWNLKQIGYCLRKLDRMEDAVKYYRDAERLAPDDLHLKAAIAYTYLQQTKYEEALDYYLQLEEASDSKRSAKRPVAWCALLLGKTDMARHYYTDLISTNPNHYDYMNMGHTEWIDGNVAEAINNYISSIRSEGNSLKKFLIGFEDDKKHLMANGVDKETIPLVIDYMRYLLQEH